jgi:UDPglucose--hexose-1-phosphate uridylyltransferase
MSNIFSDSPHRRYNALTGEWVLVSPQRTKRPWQGKQEESYIDDPPQYDPQCYLCPGNVRAGGLKNPKYKNTYVFTNDFAALFPDTKKITEVDDPIFKLESIKGTSRVICFSPRHDLTLPEMSHGEIRCVIDVWIEQLKELVKNFKWVQVFENKGEVMGCSNPHPHGQIWASDSIPNEPLKEDKQQGEYYKKNNSVLLIEYLKKEQQKKKRIILENKYWIVLVPFWAIWPFETLLLPRRHIQGMLDMIEEEKEALADILKSLLIRYDNLFNTSFPYTMGWHGAPNGDEKYFYWQLHAHFYPPLLRSANVKKFMVGYEMLAEAQRDMTPEQAVERLLDVPDIHYKKNLINSNK